MSSSHRSATPGPTQDGVGQVLVGSEGAKTSGAERAQRRRERRGSPRRVNGGRVADGAAAIEARLAQERQRIAAEVHDLVMQDVSFALATARSIAGDPEFAGSRAEAAVLAGERALAGARAIVSGLAERDRRPATELFEESVRTAARGVPLTVEISDQSGGRPDQETTDALVHIGREAVTNAVKHGHPNNLVVSLAHEDEWNVRVSDDGCGFDAADDEAGFGLGSIRARALALGGSAHIESASGQGTVVEVSLP